MVPRIAIALLVTTLLGGPAAGASTKRIPGHVLPALAGATRVSPAESADAAPLTLTLVLERDDRAGFDRYLHDVYDPRSPRFRRFLTQHEIAERFGPSRRTYDRLVAYLRANGFAVVQGSTNRLTVTVRGDRRAAARAFGVRVASPPPEQTHTRPMLLVRARAGAMSHRCVGNRLASSRRGDSVLRRTRCSNH